jgi:transcriptional regulator with XRE-family HTH domain
MSIYSPGPFLSTEKVSFFIRGDKFFLFLYTGGMTLHLLLAKHGIFRPIDLAKRAGLSRQYAQMLWAGHRDISRAMARKISAATGIPYADLLLAEKVTPPPTPRGRPRKTPRP